MGNPFTSDRLAVIIIGADMTGSAVFQDLVRFLAHMVEIHVVDGGTVKEADLARQHFTSKDVGKNKARVLQARATGALGLDRVFAHPYDLTDVRQLHDLAQFYASVILIGTVDNRLARSVQEQFVRETKVATYYLCLTDGEYAGGVMALCRTDEGEADSVGSPMDPSHLTDVAGEPVRGGLVPTAGKLPAWISSRMAAIISLELVAKALKGNLQTGLAHFHQCRISRVTPALTQLVAGRIAVILVGAGGIGSAVFQDLVRYLSPMIEIHLVDGDLVEGRNLQRQHFTRKDLRRNKASALHEKARDLLKREGVQAHAFYLTEPEQLHQIARNYSAVILIGGVDNHPARKVQEQFVRETKVPTYYLCLANGENSGEVFATYQVDGAQYGFFRSHIDPSVLTDEEGDPTRRSCGQQLDAGSIQTLVANRKAAIIALELVFQALVGTIQTGIVYFDECTTAQVAVVTPAAA